MLLFVSGRELYCLVYFHRTLWYDYFTIFYGDLTMKSSKNLLLYTSLAVLLGILDIIFIFFFDIGENQNRLVGAISLFIIFVWFCGIVILFVKRKKQNKIISKLLIAANSISLCILVGFCILYCLAINHRYTGDFSIQTSLFDNKNVLVIVPHQDDDINLVGGLIEQYTHQGSDVTVVFSTNGDGTADAEVRAAEAVSVLTPLGVKKENIYYLGFGDQWKPQTFGDTCIPHIYNSPDPDCVWTSDYGATATYGTQSIPCYLELPYTRNNYLHSFESIIRDVMPDTIFAVDFDEHIDHKATDLFFEEALCNVIRSQPDYHPTVYKGFCYGTAWEAVPDFHDDLNLLSTKKPDDSIWSKTSFGYVWEDRVRFPISDTNLNIVLLNNSVYHSFNDYDSQFAYTKAGTVLNGDKVFWERRTDSLLYDAEISVAGETVFLLNDFKLKDFSDISASPGAVSGVAFLNENTVQVNLEEAVTANCIYLYDHPDQAENILEGYIVFDDGTTIEFGELNADGSPTEIFFPEKQIKHFEIVPTKLEGDYAGLSEIELYDDAPDSQESETYFMAVDPDDNFAYDYIIHDGDTATFKLYRFPYAEQVNKEDITLHFESDNNDNSYRWDNDSIIVNCAKGSKCTVTISADGTSTTFGVSNPSGFSRAYLSALHNIGKVAIDTRFFLFRLYLVFYRIVN